LGGGGWVWWGGRGRGLGQRCGGPVFAAFNRGGGDWGVAMTKEQKKNRMEKEKANRTLGLYSGEGRKGVIRGEKDQPWQEETEFSSERKNSQEVVSDGGEQAMCVVHGRTNKKKVKEEREK